MLRQVLGVLVGYLVFAAPVMLFFRVAGRDPHAPAGLGFVLGSLAFGVVCALVGGWLAARIATTPARAVRWPVLGVAALIALGAAATLVFELRHGGAMWSPLAGLLLMPAAVLVGGSLYRRSVT